MRVRSSRIVSIRVPAALTCALIFGAGCGVLPSGPPAGKLVAEDSGSSQMKMQNCQLLGSAIASKRNDDLKYYLDQQPDLAKKTFAGKTLLFDAAFFGNLPAVLTLVKHGADVNFTTALGERPLDRAIASGHPGVIDYLKQQGATPGRKM